MFRIGIQVVSWLDSLNMNTELDTIGGLSLGMKDVWVEMYCKKEVEYTWENRNGGRLA